MAGRVSSGRPRRPAGRGAFLVCLGLLACRHAGVPAAPPAPVDPAGRCAARRAEHRRQAEASRCAADGDCRRAGRYETGTCDAWVTGPDAERVLLRMRAATDEACRDRDVEIAPACWPLAGACVAGRCTSSEAATSPARDLAALPEEPACVADALLRALPRLPPGSVELRFPLSPDGAPPRYFEAVGPVDPGAAAGVARACSGCRWRLRSGGAIPAAAWGAVLVRVGD